MALARTCPLSVAVFVGTAALVTCYHQAQLKAKAAQRKEIFLKVTGLQRFAVKGLGPDELQEVELTSNAFPDDRRYALWQTKKEAWKEDTWLHKENFLCAFTHPQLLAKYVTSFQDCHLVLLDRSTRRVLVGPVNMETKTGRAILSSFLSQESGVSVQCITSKQGDFHFGNTGSATKATPVGNSDPKARCMHVVFQATVDALAAKIGIETLNASRFRPNIILQNAPGCEEFKPFQELQCVGKTLEAASSTLKLKIINKTVRCAGVREDPLDPKQDALDIPHLLMKHFPEHGPYLGVYCTVEKPGTLTLGDTLRLVA